MPRLLQTITKTVPDNVERDFYEAELNSAVLNAVNGKELRVEVNGEAVAWERHGKGFFIKAIAGKVTVELYDSRFDEAAN